MKKEEKDDLIIIESTKQKVFDTLFLSDAEKSLKRLEDHNKSASERKGNSIFHVQGFAVISTSKHKAKKILRSIMGSTIKNPDVVFEDLRDTMIGIKNKYSNAETPKLKL